MVTVGKYISEKKQIWDQFVATSKNGLFMFYRDYMEYHSSRFQDSSLLFYNDDKLMALLPLSIKDNVLYSHGGLTFGGFITDEAMKTSKMLQCFDALKQYMADNFIVSLIYKAIPHIYHSLPAEEDLYALFINKANILKIEPSCTITFDNTLKLPKGRKAQISRAKREGVTVEECKDFDAFIKLENEILQKKYATAAVHTGSELSVLHSKFPQNIKLFVAKHQHEIIAGSVVFEYRNVVHTQYLASNELAHEIGGLDLVISTLLEKYKGTKKYFDFGISTENDGKLLNEGLMHQKESFGGRTLIHQTFEFII